MDNFKLNEIEKNRWFKNLLIFLSPVAIIYIVAIIGFIQANNGAVKLNDFVPNQFTLGAMSLYILNTILDYLRKVRS